MILGIVYWGYARSLSNFNGGREAESAACRDGGTASGRAYHEVSPLGAEEGPGSVKKGALGVLGTHCCKLCRYNHL